MTGVMMTAIFGLVDGALDPTYVIRRHTVRGTDHQIDTARCRSLAQGFRLHRSHLPYVPVFNKYGDHLLTH